MAVLNEQERPKLQWVRSIYGSGSDAKQKYNYIPGGMNTVIQDWHSKQPEREFICATPSRLMTCPRAVWLQVHGVKETNSMGWGTLQRMMLGRQLEDMFAMQLADEGILLEHWKDNPGDKIEPFKLGEGLDQLIGVPDYLLTIDNKVTISDAKTSRSDSFGYVPMNAPEIWTDTGWNKYRVQVNAYFMLYNANREKKAEQCHLFSYALDDGVVRREVLWTPTEADLEEVKKYTRRFNAAMQAKDCPECTCGNDKSGFNIKFCRYGSVPPGSKIATSCCDDSLITKGE